MQYDDTTDILTVGPDPDTAHIAQRPMRSAIAPLLQMVASLPVRKRNAAHLLKSAARLGDMLGEDGLYSFPAGGGRVEGLTADAARALANEYGQVAFGVQLDSVTGDRVECTAYAVDLAQIMVIQRPAVFHVAPPPGKFARSHEQRERWKAMQMQSGFSKAVRGAILQLIPLWMQRACMDSIRDRSKANALAPWGGDVAKAIAATIKAYGDMGVSIEQLEDHAGQARDLWTVRDIVHFVATHNAIQGGDTTIAAEFPVRAASEPVGLAELPDAEGDDV